MIARDPGSYRDPAGFVYRRDGRLLRQVERTPAFDWPALRDSGLLARLAERGLLVGSREVGLDLAAEPGAAAVLELDELGFISYPYEWPAGALRDAALLTLEVERCANEAGFTLRDASPYNVTLRGATPVFIDQLSFEPLVPGRPWAPYLQFAEGFLAPLALAVHREPALASALLRARLDGIELPLAASLLPARTRLSLGLATHLHLHARAVARAGSSSGRGARATLAPRARAHLLAHLRTTIEGLSPRAAGTVWADYEGNTSYTDPASAAKELAVARAVEDAGARVVWDLGANAGRYTRVALGEGAERVVALDVDPGAVERHYRRLRAGGEERVTPLVVDLANPGPALGWALAERRSLWERADAELVLALALVHHLAIGANVPLGEVAALFARLGEHLLVEWVPPDDPMVRRLLADRPDVFGARYTEEAFRSAFGARFETLRDEPLPESERRLLHLRRR